MRKWSNVRASTLILPAIMPLVLVGGMSHAATQVQPSKSSQESAVDPQAKDALTRMSDHLKSLQSFAVHEDIAREQVINGDLKVQKSFSADAVVRRPDRFKANVVGDDDKNHTVFFDGKMITVYMPARKYYAQMESPGTIGDALDIAQSRYGVELPATDFMRTAPGDDFIKGLTAAGEVGKSRVGSDDCEHYAYRTADVDYQLWIESGDKPLPRKLVITSKKQPTQPEYTVLFTWDLSPKIDDAAFAFTPPEGVTKIAFGAPPAAATSPKTQPQKQPQKK
jgi:hypothetical protein